MPAAVLPGFTYGVNSANGIITGGYLTTGGNEPNRDIMMIKEIGLKAN